MDKPRFDDETGAALNAAAERLVQRAKAPTCDDGPGTAAASGAGLLSDIPIVDIAIGKHKYVQIELTAPGEAPIRVVRSYAGLSYHADNYERAMELLHNEITIWEGLKHENLVQLIDVFETDTELLLVRPAP